jgi:glycosyltransferase involved in cell wall biosynthesis
LPPGPPPHLSLVSTSRRIGLLSTYPPQLCGLATFSAALEHALRRAGDQVDVVRIDDDDSGDAVRWPVVAKLVNGMPDSIRNAAAALSRCDVAIIQHEYGIFGGDDGDEVLDLLELTESPTIVILHTVPLVPTPHQRWILLAISELASQVVVMTETARSRLTSLYSIDPGRVATISHGASLPTPDPRPSSLLDPPPQLLTWGLLGPGKGIEHAIEALALLCDIRPLPRYTVAGVTHPKVLARHGDDYRRSLIDLARRLGVSGSVTFDDTYRDVAHLTRFVASSSIVVLPYDSREQVTSGVLVDAIAAGRPVIATAFPHAVEMLSSGAGIVVPHGDPVALAAAIRSALTDPTHLAAMADEARRLAPRLSWSSIAAQYLHLADQLVRSHERVAT